MCERSMLAILGVDQASSFADRPPPSRRRRFNVQTTAAEREVPVSIHGGLAAILNIAIPFLAIPFLASPLDFSIKLGGFYFYKGL